VVDGLQLVERSDDQCGVIDDASNDDEFDHRRSQQLQLVPDPGRR
jgi:hypothetical protein